MPLGRKPRTENVGLEKTKVELERGFVKTDEYMRTAEPGIYVGFWLALSSCYGAQQGA